MNASRDADWLTVHRMRNYGALAAIGLATMTVWLLVAPLHRGIPGGDFVSFYAASRLALSGDPAGAWNLAVHGAAERAVLGPHVGYLSFLYPPPYLLVCWPLALLPFGASLFVWIGFTLAAALICFSALLRQVRVSASAALLLLALPAVWVNVLAGQNGALSLAILSLGFACLDRRPVTGGLILGLMIIKPQLALALPFMLLASNHWRAFFSMAISAALMLVLAWAAVGLAGYGAFLNNLTHVRAAFDGGAVDSALMQTVFGMLQPWSLPAAYVAQGLVSLTVLLVAMVVVRKRSLDAPALSALAVASTLAATPFLLDYDLIIAAIPIGWLIASGLRTGFRSWEVTSCLLYAVFPLFARVLSLNAHLNLAALMSLLLVLLVVRRILYSPVISLVDEPV